MRILVLLGSAPNTQDDPCVSLLGVIHCHWPPSPSWICTSCSKVTCSVLAFNFGNKEKGLGEAAGLPGKREGPWVPTTAVQELETHSNSDRPGVESFQGLVPGLLLQAAHGWVASHRHGHRTQHQGGDGLHGQDIDLGPLRVFLQGEPTRYEATSHHVYRAHRPWFSGHTALQGGALSAMPSWPGSNSSA